MREGYSNAFSRLHEEKCMLVCMAQRPHMLCMYVHNAEWNMQIASRQAGFRKGAACVRVCAAAYQMTSCFYPAG